eukprot:TRINITY_DN24880_c0_g1_i1.p1 TRINITY_DN24880_c0_g1~~TRINITY_DN24880_c0_g1_i1.p1  ORF type:complete len:361 (+),score=94.37 TRINITY_DN24880_c0_g1_i1:57-1139(+)
MPAKRKHSELLSAVAARRDGEGSAGRKAAEAPASNAPRRGRCIWEVREYRRALERIGFPMRRTAACGTAADSVPLVEVWDRLLVIVGNHADRGLPLDAARRRKLTELAHGCLPAALLRILAYWVDGVAWEKASLRREIDALLAADFVEADYTCGVAPLVMALLPFDPIAQRDAWCAAQCEALSCAADRQGSMLAQRGVRERAVRCLLAFHTCPGPRQRVFMYKARAVRHVIDDATGRVTRDTGAIYLRRVRGGACTDGEAPLPSDVAGDAHAPGPMLPDIEALILEWLPPRDLRVAEVTCKAWAAAVMAAPPLRARLRLGAFVRNRFVRFFEEAWGDECVDVHAVAGCRAEAFTRLGFTH